MLQQLQSTGLRGAAPASVLLRATLPALRQWRAYGFGAHVSDNDPQASSRRRWGA